MTRNIFIPVLLICCSLFASCGPGDPMDNAVPVSEAQPGDLVIATGRLRAEPAGDSVFFQYGRYAHWKRSVQVYAYQQSGTAGEEGCTSNWTGTPDLDVHQTPGCAGNRNRRSFVPNREGYADLTLVTDAGEYSVRAGWEVRGIPERAITTEDLVPNQRMHHDGTYFYFNKYCVDAPRHECERVRLLAYPYDPEATYSVIGRLVVDGEQRRIAPYSPPAGEDGETVGEIFLLGPAAAFRD